MRQYRRTRKSLVALPDCNLTQHQRRMKLFPRGRGPEG